MDKSIITDLVFGEPCYAEKIKMNENKEYSRCYKEYEQKLEEICKDMPKEKKDKFLFDIPLLQMGIESEASQKFFEEGFKLGMRIAAHCFLS